MKSVIISLLFIPFTLNAQIPINDQTWDLKWNDEFDFNYYGGKTQQQQFDYLLQNWWFDRWCPPGSTENTHFGSYDLDNITLNNGLLTLILKRESVTESWSLDCNKQSINPPITKQYDFSGVHMHLRNSICQSYRTDYGLYELNFRIPIPDQYGSPTLMSRNFGIQTAWWLFGSGFNRNNSKRACWSEIDFFEISGFENRFTHNFLFSYDQPYTSNPRCGGMQFPPSLTEINFNTAKKKYGTSLENYSQFYKESDPFLSHNNEGFHVLSCEVLKEKIVWYIDGKYLNSTVGSTLTSFISDLPIMENELMVKAAEGFDPNMNGINTDDIPNINTIFPYAFEIDYIRFYKSNCFDHDLYLNSVMNQPFDNKGIYNRIFLGDQNSTLVRTNEKLLLRADQFIELNPGFTVELGGEMYLDVGECQN